jgi:riboflavin kinase/FMN adenylyltransferase
MKVFEGFINGFNVQSPVVTIGTFDGVHIGHQKIIQQLNKEANKLGGESTLFTFYPHPRMVLFPDNTDLKLLQTKEEKIQKLERMGLQNIVMYPFSREFSQLTATEFVRDILVAQMKVKKLVIGYDHQFGKNREGGLEFLKQVAPDYGFDVLEIPAQEIEDVNVSSSKIRKALLNGQVEIAHSYLSEPYEITGKVVYGSALGRTIQFPTANLDLETELKLIPKNGVYAVLVKLSNEDLKMGMMNIGTKPTVQNASNISLEVHILDFDKNLYGEVLTVQFLSYLRDEQKFSSTESLKNQLIKDAESTRSYFNTLD